MGRLIAKSPRHACSVLVAVAMLVVAVTSSAQVARADSYGLELAGSATYQWKDSSLTFAIDKVANNNPLRTSAALKLQLWAFASPFDGDGLDGHLLGEASLSALGPLAYHSAVSRTVPYTPPSAGSYYPSLVLLEAEGGGYSVRDYLNFDLTNFGTPPPSDLKLAGACGWSINGAQITITAAKVQNKSTSASGILRLEVWASSAKYTGGTLSGYRLGEAGLGQLAARTTIKKVSKTTGYTKPAAGRYYTAITLTEWDGSKWVIRDYKAIGKRTRF